MSSDDGAPPVSAIPEGGSVVAAREIAGFWRRSAAFAFDCLVLRGVGAALGCVAFDQLVRLGWFGRIVGLVVATGYFGLLNSSIGRGRTPGKWLTGIEVVARNGRPLGVLRSIARTLVLAIPFFWSGWPWEGDTYYSFAGFWVSFAETMIPLSTGYLVVCDRRTRQGLHDLVAGSFVVMRRSTGEVRPRRTWRYHYAAIAVGALVFTFSFLRTRFEIRESVSAHPWNAERFKASQSTMDELENMGRGRRCSLGGRFFDSERIMDSSEPLIDAWVDWGSRPEDVESTAAKIASVVLRLVPEANPTDTVAITVEYGYSIGIGYERIRKPVVHTVAEWQRILNSHPHR